MLHDSNTYPDGEQRLWAVLLHRQTEPRMLVYLQAHTPSARDVHERLAAIGQDAAQTAFTAFDLNASVALDPGTMNALDSWGRRVLAEGVSVGPLVDVAAGEFALTPWKRVRYGKREQFFDDGGCLQGEIHYGLDGAPTRWLVDMTLLRAPAH